MIIPHPEGPLEQAFWIDLCEPTPDEVAAVEAAAGLVLPTHAELSEIESTSRLRTQGDILVLSTPILTRGDSPDPDLTPMGFVLSARRLVTIRYAPLRAVDAAAAEVACIERPSSAGVFTALLEAIVDRAADLLEGAGAELDLLSRQIFSNADVKRTRLARADHSLRETLGRVGRLGDRLGKIRGSLLGVSRIAPFVGEMAREWLPVELHSRLGAVRTDILSLADYETHLEGKTQFLLDAVLGFINTEQNDLFKILTIVSVVGVPPTLIASIYGMNFAHMPELQWKLGYPYAIVAIVVSAVLPMMWFKRKGWW